MIDIADPRKTSCSCLLAYGTSAEIEEGRIDFYLLADPNGLLDWFLHKYIDCDEDYHDEDNDWY